jgi:hypothetical protein
MKNFYVMILCVIPLFKYTQHMYNITEYAGNVANYSYTVRLRLFLFPSLSFFFFHVFNIDLLTFMIRNKCAFAWLHLTISH